ncbi:MAG: biotin--[acetyl-CoA-carboxylase] ligase [Halanaerobiaceae bacterium]
MKINKMKLKILKMLNNEQEDFISGADISKRMGVSRTTVSNYIKELRKTGYVIESRTNQGYNLKKVPDTLIPEEIFLHLETKYMGRNIEYLPQTESTNTTAKNLAASGVEEGTMVLAEKQSSGRGRRGKEWFSPGGTGLWFSLILRPEFTPEKASFLTILTALSLEKVLREYRLKPFIKWPNDIYVDNKKVAGILSEISAEIDFVKYAVVGIGINVNQEYFPEDIKEKATSLKIVSGQNISRKKLLSDILLEFENFYELLLANEEKEILKQWKNKLDILGHRVQIKTNNRDYYGRAIDISEGGALILEDESGKQHKFWAGEASLDWNKND